MARTDGFWKIASSVLSDDFGSLRTNMDCSSYWGTPLSVTDRGLGKFILACGLLGGGL